MLSRLSKSLWSWLRRQNLSWSGLAGAFVAAGRDDEAYDAVVKWHEIAVSEGAIQYRGEAPDKEILKLRVQLALLRLGRWPYQLEWRVEAVKRVDQFSGRREPAADWTTR